MVVRMIIMLGCGQVLTSYVIPFILLQEVPQHLRSSLPESLSLMCVMIMVVW